MSITGTGIRCRHEWGRRGAREAAARGDILVVVDVLSFSTTVITAVQYGATMYPCLPEEDPYALAARVEGEVAARWSDVPARGRFSLSPLGYIGLEAGTRVVLTSPNGATCTLLSREAPVLLAGALVNAHAVAAAATRLLNETDLNLSVVSCGERWPGPAGDEGMRVALEDYLGAGAILAALDCPASPEARVCANTFTAVRGEVSTLIWECESGRELRDAGFGDDVRHAALLDLYDAVPVMHGEAFERYSGAIARSSMSRKT
ncbi:MAG TPA: 2-phosphosulfolactate phosphatase [Chloroflexota bacterium]|nr:2-phosphosulfolactate phosphatase [Chloroflexota bacterium]